MAVVPRKTKAGIVYYVDTRGHRERVGGDKREAQRLDARRKRELKEGTFAPLVTGAITVGKYLTQWLASRKNRSVETERYAIETHALTCSWLCALRMDDVRPIHAKKFFLELQAKPSRHTGQPLKPKYVANIHGVLKAAFNAAVLDEVITRDVWRLPPGLLSKKSAERVPYSREDAARLLAANTGIRRVWLAMAFYTGMRCGEIAGRRWRDLDLQAKPMPCLTVATQYSDQPLKTDRPRKIPVHPELVAILADWCLNGFAEQFTTEAFKDDFILPSQHDVTQPISRFAARNAMRTCCQKAGVPDRGVHATRHTFISEIQRGGADQRVVERITHNASGSMIDHYTHRHWDELCAAMACLAPYQILDAALDEPPGDPENIGSDSRTRTQGSAADSREYADYVATELLLESLVLKQKPQLDALLAASQDSRLSRGEQSRLGMLDAEYGP